MRSQLLLILVFAATSVLHFTAADGTCTTLNLVFVIDESQSVGNESYEDIKKFLISTATYLNDGSKNLISPDNIGLALVRFSTDAKVEYYLDTLTSLEKWKSNVTTLTWMNGHTNTGKALEFVKTEVFSAANGYRPDVPAAIILVADGNWNIGPDPVPIAHDLIQQFQAKIFSVVVTGRNYIDFEIFDNISGRSDYVFNITDYSKLETLTQTLAELACKNAKCSADVLFIVETSEIIGESVVMDTVLYDMVPSIADLIGMGQTSSHASLVTFSSPDRQIPVSKVQFTFNEGTSHGNILSRCKKLTWFMVWGISDLDLGLDLAVTAFTNSSYGARNCPGTCPVPRVAVVIATGYYDVSSSCCPDPAGNIDALRKLAGNNIYVVMVEVPGKSNRTVLEMITGSEDRVYEMAQYKNVAYDINSLLQTVDCTYCSGDIAFLVETSELVTEYGVEEIKKYMLDMTEHFNIGVWQTHEGLVHFSNPPRTGLGHTAVQFDFNQGQTMDSVNKSVNNMNWPDVRGLSDLGGGLKMVRDKIFTAAAGERKLSPDILIVFALGYWDKDQDFLNPIPEARALNEHGVTIYTVMVPIGGTGPHGKLLELAAQCETDSCNKTLIDIAGSRDRFYSTDNYFEIPTVINNYLLSRECERQTDPHEHLKELAGEPVDQHNVDDMLVDVNTTVGMIINELDYHDIYHIALLLGKIAAVPQLSNFDFLLFMGIVDRTLEANYTAFAESAARHDSCNLILNSFKVLDVHLTAHQSLYLTGKNLAYTVTPFDCNDKSQTGLADTKQGFEQSFDGKYFQSSVHAAIQLDHGTLCNANVHKVRFTIYRNLKLFIILKKRVSNGTMFAETETKKPLPCTVVHNKPATERAVSASLIRAMVDIIMVSVDFDVPFDKVGLHGTLNPGFWTSKDWNQTGCYADDSSSEFAGHCTHLTDFTVLVDASEKDPALCDTTLRVIGYILSSCSLISLFLLLLNSILGLLLPRFVDLSNSSMGNFLLYSARRGDLIGRSHLGTLFLFFLFFTFFMDRQTLSLAEKGCKTIAGMNYCILLMVVCWTLFQAFNTLGKFFTKTKLGNLLAILRRPYVAVIVCLGLPILLTVITSGTVDDFFDRNDYFCWVRPDYVTPAVVVPFCLLIVGDLLATAILVYEFFFEIRTDVGPAESDTMDNPSKPKTRIQSKDIDQAEFNRNILVLISMQIVLGLPWILQCFTFGSPHLKVGNYLFTIFNASQGVFIVMLYLYGRHTAIKAMRSSAPATTSIELSTRPVAQSPLRPHDTRAAPVDTSFILPETSRPMTVHEPNSADSLEAADEFEESPGPMSEEQRPVQREETVNVPLTTSQSTVNQNRVYSEPSDEITFDDCPEKPSSRVTNPAVISLD